MNSIGIAVYCEGIFRNLLMKWARAKTCLHPLVNLQHDHGSYCTSSGALEWERRGQLLHVRDGCDDMRRGLAEVSGPPFSRMVPPLAVLKLQNDRLGYAAVSLLGAVITVSYHCLLCSCVLKRYCDH
jgi:hypothetical protein